jgi:hypothetical protein
MGDCSYFIVSDETLYATKSGDDVISNGTNWIIKDFYLTNDALCFLEVPTSALFGVEEIETDADGYESPYISYVENDKLSDIIKELENVNILELENKFNPKIMRQEKIYPVLMWDTEEKENIFKNILIDYNNLLNFYRIAKEKKANVIIQQYENIENYDITVFDPIATPKNRIDFQKWHSDTYYRLIKEDELENKSLKNWLEDFCNIFDEDNTGGEIYIELKYGENAIFAEITFNDWDWVENEFGDPGEINKVLQNLAKKNNLGLYEGATDKIIFPDGKILPSNIIKTEIRVNTT